MKHLSWLVIGLGVLCLAMIPLAGCGAKSEYEALEAQYATLVEENTRLRAQYETLQTEHRALMEENTTLKAELEQVQPNSTDIEEAYATLESEYATLESEYATLESEYATLKEEHAAIRVQLNKIKGVCPPRHFADFSELQNWLDKRLPELSQVGLKGHLELQQMALADGYVWSVCVGIGPLQSGVASYCVAGNTVFWVDLEGNIAVAE